MLLIKLKVLSKFLTSLLYFFVFTVTNVEGYTSGCKMNQTIFVPEKSTVTFLANLTNAHSVMRFRKTDSSYHNILYARVRENNITGADVLFFDRSWENRTRISSQLSTDNLIAIRIDVSNISMKDNGTYLLTDFDVVACFILFIMQIRLEPSETGAIEENKPVYVYAHPHASVIARSVANATMVWLLDGLSVNQTAGFVQQDGMVWIPRILRGFDGKNVTYRALHDNGNVNDINNTLNVMYGPSQPLTLVPRQTQYYLDSGNVMPDITCTAECKPSCSISWGKYSSGRTLSLGTVTFNDTGEYTCTATRAGSKTAEQTVNIHVADERAWVMHLSPKKSVYIVPVGDMFPDILCTADCNPPCDISWGIHSPNGQLKLGSVSKEMTGEYTCTATRKGSNRRVEKTVTIHVQDNTSFTIAIACLATVQALTTLGLGLCALLICRRNKQSPCQMCFNTIVRKFPNKNADDVSKSHAADNHGLEHYEELDTNTRQTNKVYEVSQDVSTDAGLETYENIMLSSSSAPGKQVTQS